MLSCMTLTGATKKQCLTKLNYYFIRAKSNLDHSHSTEKSSRLHSRLWHWYYMYSNCRSQEIWRARNKGPHHWQSNSHFPFPSSRKCLRICTDHLDFHSWRLKTGYRGIKQWTSLTIKLNTLWGKNYQGTLYELEVTATSLPIQCLGTEAEEYCSKTSTVTKPAALSLIRAHTACTE